MNPFCTNCFDLAHHVDVCMTSLYMVHGICLL